MSVNYQSRTKSINSGHVRMHEVGYEIPALGDTPESQQQKMEKLKMMTQQTDARGGETSKNLVWQSTSRCSLELGLKKPSCKTWIWNGASVKENIIKIKV